MKTNDYVKYMTETFVKYIDQPKDQRQKLKHEKKEMKEPFLSHWFGVIPYLIISMLKRKR